MISVFLILLAVQVTPELRQHVEAGLKAKASGDLAGAVNEFIRVVQLAPNLPAAHVNLGAVYFDQKKYSAAIPEFRKALELQKDLPGVHAMLGAALLSQGFASSAVPHLETAKSEDLLGVALLESGRPRDAIDHLEAALGSRPSDPDLLFYLSAAYGQLAKLSFEKLKETSPDSARVQQAIGNGLTQMGKSTEAAEHLRAALAKRPDLHEVHLALGDLYLEAGDYDKAEQEFRTEAQLVPGSAVAAFKLGLVLLNRGKAKDAVAELSRSNTLQPGIPETLMQLAKAMTATGNLGGAVVCLEELIKGDADPKLYEAAHFQLAQAYRRLGRTEDAERELRRFRELRDKPTQNSVPSAR